MAEASPASLRWKTLRAYAVHGYTASGVVAAFLAVVALMAEVPDPRWVFLWLAVAGIIDATDGPLARRWDVKTYAARVQGRVIDDIVDYLTFTFVPLLLIWRMGWVPDPALLFVLPALLTSVVAFARVGIKQEEDGFFVGFPSYWNLVAFYIGWWGALYGRWVPAMLMLGLAVLTLLPVRFLYPNRTPQPYRRFILWGGWIWMGVLLVSLPFFPEAPAWLFWASLSYPAAYVGLSWWVGRRTAR